MLGFMNAKRPPVGVDVGVWLAWGDGVIQTSGDVSKWFDEFGWGQGWAPMDAHHFVQTANASPNGRRAAFVLDGLEGYRVTAPSATAGFHTFWAIKSGVANAVNNPGLHACGTSGQGTNFPYSDDGIYDDFGYSTRLNGIAGHGADLRAGCIYEVECDASANWKARVNGTQVGTQTGGTKGFQANLQIGATGGGAWQGKLMAIVQAKAPLSSANAAALRAWLTAECLT